MSSAEEPKKRRTGRSGTHYFPLSLPRGALGAGAGVTGTYWATVVRLKGVLRFRPKARQLRGFCFLHMQAALRSVKEQKHE